MYVSATNKAQLPTITEEYNRRKARELDRQRRSQVIIKKEPTFPPLEKMEDEESEYINSVLGEFALIKLCGLLKEYGINKPKSYLVTPPSSPKAVDSIEHNEVEKRKILTENKENHSPTKGCLECLKRKERREMRKLKQIAKEKAPAPSLKSIYFHI